MGIIDTHTHLDSFAQQGQLDDVLKRARSAGVEAMIAVGTGLDDWPLYSGIAAGNPGFVSYSVGLHPCGVGADWEMAVARIEEYWKSGAVRPVALGECGLDRFHLPKDPAEAERTMAWQKAAFAAQLAIASRQRCPLIVHSRGAFGECVEMIDKSGVEWPKVVFHCFAEGVVEMAELTRRGGFGSFTGILTYKNAENVRQAAKVQGLSRFMVETDAPYLAPAPHRGKTNEPAFVRHVAEYAAAEIFKVPFDELAGISTANARRFFGIQGTIDDPITPPTTNEH